MITQVHVESRGTYGARRVHAELTMDRGITVGHNAVAMLMQRASLHGLTGARLGIVPACVEAREVGVARRDRPDVLGAVEAPGPVFVVRMEPDGDDAAAEARRQPVVVVPAIGATLVAGPMGAEATEGLEEHRSTVREHSDADGTVLRVESDRHLRDRGLRSRLLHTLDVEDDARAFVPTEGSTNTNLVPVRTGTSRSAT
ncbi:MAG: transposase [Actinomycetota bacterium]